jgi:hypothetical protein
MIIVVVVVVIYPAIFWCPTINDGEFAVIQNLLLFLGPTAMVDTSHHPKHYNSKNRIRCRF